MSGEKHSIRGTIGAEDIARVVEKQCEIANRGFIDDHSKFHDHKSSCVALWTNLLQKFVGKYGKASVGNKVVLFDDGDECFKEMLERIDCAVERVWMEVYIFDQSKVAEQFVKKLCSASLRGCDVVLVLDWIGSFSIKSQWIELLEKCGVSVVLFNPVLPISKSIGPVFFRDHRKILIVDYCGYCGSLNICNEAGGKILGNSRFYDTHLRVEGPAVYDLAEIFNESLSEAFSGLSRRLPRVPDVIPGGILVQVLESNVRKNRRTIQPVLESVVRNAETSIALTSSYFVPPGFLRRALQSSARRGVPVSILLSGNSDIPGDVMASTYLVKKFLVGPKNNSRTYFMKDQHCHAKCLSVDGLWGSVGSFNWDRYSSRRNLEVVVSFFDSDLSCLLKSLHDNKVRSNSVEEMTLKQWHSQNPIKRFFQFVCYSMVRISGRNILDGLSNNHEKVTLRRQFIDDYFEERTIEHVAGSMMWGIQ